MELFDPLHTLGALALSAVMALALCRWLCVLHAARWPAMAHASMAGAGYRDSVRVEVVAGRVDTRVQFVVAVALAHAAFFVLSNVDFARTAVRVDLWRVHPEAVRLVVIQDAFLIPATVLFLQAAFALVRRDVDAPARAGALHGECAALDPHDARARGHCGRVRTQSGTRGVGADRACAAGRGDRSRRSGVVVARGVIDYGAARFTVMSYGPCSFETHPAT
jgi:hypothetical protein